MTALARGTYRYRRDGTPIDITEPWELSRHADGLVLAGRRLQSGKALFEVEAEYRGKRCTDLRLVWQPGAAARTLHYRLRGEFLGWTESDDRRSLDVPENALLFPLLRAATGPLLRQLARARRCVVVPDLHDPADARQFLRPLLSERRAVAPGGPSAEERHYRYVGGEYGEAGSDWWVDRRDLALRYAWDSPHGRWDVRLEDAWTSEDFDGFR